MSHKWVTAPFSPFLLSLTKGLDNTFEICYGWTMDNFVQSGVTHMHSPLKFRLTIEYDPGRLGAPAEVGADEFLDWIKGNVTFQDFLKPNGETDDTLATITYSIFED